MGDNTAGGATLWRKVSASDRNSYDEGGEVVRRSQQPLSAQLQSTRRHLCAPWHMPRAHMCAHRVSRNTRAVAASIIYTLLPSTRPLLTPSWLGARGSRPCSGLALSLPWATKSANAYSGLAAVRWRRPARHGTTGATPEVSADVA